MKRGALAAPLTPDLMIVTIVIALPMRGVPMGSAARRAIPMAGFPAVVTGRAGPVAADPDVIRARGDANDHFLARRRRRRVDIHPDRNIGQQGSGREGDARQAGQGDGQGTQRDHPQRTLRSV